MRKLGSRLFILLLAIFSCATFPCRATQRTHSRTRKQRTHGRTRKQRTHSSSTSKKTIKKPKLSEKHLIGAAVTFFIVSVVSYFSYTYYRNSANRYIRNNLIEAIHKIETENQKNQTEERDSAIATAEKEAINIINSGDTDLNAEYRGDIGGYWMKTPLYAACSRGYTKIVKALLAKGAQLKSVIKGETPLHLATRCGHLDTVMSLVASKNQLKIDIDAENKDGETALSLAYHYNRPEMVKILLDNGADPTKKYKKGQNILHYVCKYYMYRNKSKHLQTVKHLLEDEKRAGKMLLAQDEEGNTPLHIACRAIEDWPAETVEMLLELPKANNALKIKNNLGRTPLHEACKNGTIGNDGPETLLKHKADPNSQDNQGKTSLHLASYIGDKEKVKLLLKYKADPGIKDSNGDGPTSTMAASVEINEEINQLINKARG